MSEKAKASKQLVNLQIMRAVAALMVVVHHGLQASVSMPLRTPGSMRISDLLGIVGVNAFFCISGFIMYATAGNSFGERAAVKRFAVHRAGRIFPMYALATLAAVALPALQNRSTPTTPSALAMNILFLPHFLGGQVEDFVLSVGWTLSFEAVFYVLLGLCLLTPRRVGLTVALAFFPALWVCNATGLLNHLPWRIAAPLGFWSRDCSLLFPVGLALGWMGERSWRYPRAGVAVVVAVGALAASVWAGVLLPPYSAAWRAASLVGPALAIAVCVFSENRAPRVLRPLMAVGNSSYSLYLVHVFLLSAVALIWPLSPSFMGGVAFLLVSGAVAIAGGFIIFFALEVPLFAAVKGWTKTVRRNERDPLAAT